MSNKVNLKLPMDKNDLFIDMNSLEEKKEMLEKLKKVLTFHKV